MPKFEEEVIRENNTGYNEPLMKGKLMTNIVTKIKNLKPSTKRVIVASTVVGLGAAVVVLTKQNRNQQNTLIRLVAAMREAGLEPAVTLVPIVVPIEVPTP